MNRHRSIRLDQDQPLRHWQMGRQPPCIVHLATGNHQPHGDKDKGTGDEPPKTPAACARTRRGPMVEFRASSSITRSTCSTGSPMARRPSKHLRQARPLSSGHATSALKRDGRWIVRSVSGTAATKTYRCPGCNAEITPGTPHVVAWPDTPGLLSSSPVEERRHWHTSCWQRRP